MKQPHISPLPWPRSIEIVAVGAAWGLLAATVLVRRALLPEPPFSLHTVAVTLVEYLPWALLTPAVFWLARRLPPTRTRWIERLVLHAAIACGVAFLLGEVQSRSIEALGPPAGMERSAVHNSLAPAPPALDRAASARPAGERGGPPLFRLSYQLLFYLLILGVGFARAYAIQLRARQAETARLAAERERLAAQLAEARLQALRMQLNPHFLFNTLNAVSALAEEDPAGVRRIVSRLSALLRRVLDTETTVEVPLREELASIRDYLDIQRIRFESRLEIEENVAPEALDALLPPFILQPIVENAVEHGAGRVRDGAGRITIAARREQGENGRDSLVVVVGDNGPGPKSEPYSTAGERRGGIGIANTRERLAAHYGERGTLALNPASERGLDVELTLPWRRAGEV